MDDLAVQEEDKVGKLLDRDLAGQLLLVLGVDGGHPEPDGLQLLGETLPYRLHSEAGETPVRIKQKQVGLQNEKENSIII